MVHCRSHAQATGPCVMNQEPTHVPNLVFLAFKRGQGNRTRSRVLASIWQRLVRH